MRLINIRTAARMQQEFCEARQDQTKYFLELLKWQQLDLATCSEEKILAVDPSRRTFYYCSSCQTGGHRQVIDMIEDSGDYYFNASLICKECLTKALTLLQ